MEAVVVRGSGRKDARLLRGLGAGYGKFVDIYEDYLFRSINSMVR